MAWIQQWNRARRPPRRMKTAYAMFIRKNYKKIRLRIGTRKPQIIYRSCAQLWRNLSQEERAPYEEMSAIDRRRYFNERDTWTRRYSGRIPRMRRNRKSEDAPKRAKNAFVLFRVEHWRAMKEENPRLTQQSLLCKVAERWRGMTAEDKKKYWDEAAVESERYAMEMSQFRYQQALIDAERRYQNYVARSENMRLRERLRAQARLDALRQKSQPNSTAPP